jgi:bacteriocin-like protein
MTMVDERRTQDEPQDEVTDTEERSKELSDEELDRVVGGQTALSNVQQTQNDATKGTIQNLKA